MNCNKAQVQAELRSTNQNKVTLHRPKTA